MSLNDLSNQTNTQISEQTVASGRYGNIGAEWIKPMELHVCAVGEDANDETKEVRVSVSRTRKIRQLTEKAEQYQTNLPLDKRERPEQQTNFFTLQLIMWLLELKKNCYIILIYLSCYQLIMKSTVSYLVWKTKGMK